jgi:predicted acetyltransferase
MQFKEYIDSWRKENERISPSSCEINSLTFREWKEAQMAVAKEDTRPQGMVRADTLFLVENNGYILGAINLRYAMNEDLLKLGGHLSFGIRPEERKKGYAFIMVKLALNILRTNGITKALVTITRDNKAAQRTIRKIGGKLENAYELKGTVIDRYWIRL